MSTLPYTVTIERDDAHVLAKLAKRLDVWCIQRWGLPGLDNLWHRNRNRIYEKKGSTRYSRIYYTIYSFKEQDAVVEFKLCNIDWS